MPHDGTITADMPHNGKIIFNRYYMIASKIIADICHMAKLPLKYHIIATLLQTDATQWQKLTTGH